MMFLSKKSHVVLIILGLIGVHMGAIGGMGAIGVVVAFPQTKHPPHRHHQEQCQRTNLSFHDFRTSASSRRSSFTSLSARDQPKTSNLPVIPIIGPIINASPLMMGGEMTLDPPTPLQWKALQECVVVHRNAKNGAGDNNDDEHNLSTSVRAPKTATTHAAPLIAIIDHASGVSPVRSPLSAFKDEGGRYATLAAVVGITSKKTSGEMEELEEEDFMDFMSLCPVDDGHDEDEIIPLSSSVRLVGVGRAVLRSYFYRVPSELCEKDDTSGEDNDDDNTDMMGYTSEGGDSTDNYGYDDNTPIVMAAFEPLVDDVSVYTKADPDRVGDKGQRSYRSSPVHALSQLNNIATKVSWMHDDRRKLIAGIKAAKARLDLNQARRRGEIPYDDDLQDFDGLGQLFADEEPVVVEEEKKMTVDEFLATFKGNMMRIDPSELPQNQPSDIEKLEAMDNYGMSYYGAFSPIGSLAGVVAMQLEPYYSQPFRNREEYDLEISSFVAFRTLEDYADMADVAWSLQCISSIERLERAYEILLDHRIQLKKLANKFSDELRECGEECTDLW